MRWHEKNACKIKLVVILKLSTLEGSQSPKNGVIHEVIHVIHKKCGIFGTIERIKKEQVFCEHIIKFAQNGKILRKELTF